MLATEALNMKHCILLDIEGTTCPISFVADVLFPYARNHLALFLMEHGRRPEIQDIIKEAWQEWEQDPDPTSRQLLNSANEANTDQLQALAPYFKHLIQIDRKSTALKELQGHVWNEGFSKGALKTDLYPETIECLRDWKRQGLQIAVYSSGSVKAQKLLYAHTIEGDLRDLFCGWFDTRTGEKKEAYSYNIIAQKLCLEPSNIIFISDNGAECDAAEKAGMQTIFSLREGNPDQNPRQHRAVTSLRQVQGLLTFPS